MGETVSQRQDTMSIVWETRFVVFKYDDCWRILDRTNGLVAAFFRHGVQTPREWTNYDDACEFVSWIVQGGTINMQSYIKDGKACTLDEPLCWVPCWRYR